ncbi:MAG: CDP-alcohol phosphatidyltransferase family protein [Acidimicrobiales bacterium]
MIQPAGQSAAGAAAVPSSFGPSAVATPANAISVTRLLLAIPLFLLILDRPSSWTTLAFWVVLSATDGFDGWIARKQGTTRSGAFIDPLADKVLVLGAMWALVAAEVFWAVPVAIITAREVAISLFRSFWARRGLAVPATKGGKLKTVVQTMAVSLALFPPLVDEGWVATSALWLAVAITVITGVQYFLAGSRGTRASGRL